MKRRRKLIEPADRGPLRTMFVLTSMPVGGMETLLVNLVRRLDRDRIEPELCCLKELGPLGTTLAREVPAYSQLITHKFDLRVLWRLRHLLKRRRIDAVVTVGTGGDRMFWGRLAAWQAGVPVVLSAIHSTGYPNHVERMNRALAPITDGFIAVAETHARYLTEHEGCPQLKVFVIPNGVDTDRFRPMPADVKLRAELRLPAEAPVATIVAALRPEKNHELFLRAAAKVRATVPNAMFLIIGDGPQRAMLEALTAELRLTDAVRFVGTRGDIPELLSLTNVLVLSSHMEANPVSILEAMACGKPIVSTNVGSIADVVADGRMGYLVPAGDAEAMASRVAELFNHREEAEVMGQRGRELVVSQWSLDQMVRGYEDLITKIYVDKCRQGSGNERRKSPFDKTPRDVATKA